MTDTNAYLLSILEDGSLAAYQEGHPGDVRHLTVAQMQDVLDGSYALIEGFRRGGLAAFLYELAPAAGSPNGAFRFQFDREVFQAMTNGDRASLILALELARDQLKAEHLAIAAGPQQ